MTVAPDALTLVVHSGAGSSLFVPFLQMKPPSASDVYESALQGGGREPRMANGNGQSMSELFACAIGEKHALEYACHPQPPPFTAYPSPFPLHRESLSPQIQSVFDGPGML